MVRLYGQLALMNGLDRREIAARLRGLIAGQDGGDLGESARRIGVEELSLRMSIDEASPFPTIDVVTAIVAHYGVDPTYLLTGQYDGATHRRVLDDPAGAADAIRHLAAGQTTRPTVAQPTTEPSRLHIA